VLLSKYLIGGGAMKYLTIPLMLSIFLFSSCTPTYTVWKLDEEKKDKKEEEQSEIAYGLTQEFSHVEYNVFDSYQEESEYDTDTWVAGTYPLDEPLKGNSYGGMNIIDIYFSQQKSNGVNQLYSNFSGEDEEEDEDLKNDFIEGENEEDVRAII
jgi:hypothetical protein